MHVRDSVLAIFTPPSIHTSKKFVKGSAAFVYPLQPELKGPTTLPLMATPMGKPRATMLSLCGGSPTCCCNATDQVYKNDIKSNEVERKLVVRTPATSPDSGCSQEAVTDHALFLLYGCNYLHFMQVHG